MILIRNVFVDRECLKPTVPGAKEPNHFMSVAVGLFAACGGFIFGYDTGLINSLSEMEYFRQNFASTPGTFSTVEMAIMTSILSIGTFTGAVLAPLLSDTIGRRLAIIIATFVVFMIGNICQVSASELALFCIGRFITGVSIGIISAVVPLYQAEASPKYARGAIISTYQWTITWGLLVSSAVSQGTRNLSSSASYRVPIGLQFLWSLILGVGMIFLPETPRFYVKKDDLFKAAQALSRLRRVPTDDPGLIEELVEIKASHDYELSFATGGNSFIEFFRSDDARPHQLKRVLTAVVLQTFQQCSGINFIFYYGVNFFSRTGVQQSYLISFVTYAVNVVFTIPGIMFVETVGRRKVLMIGGTIMGFANLIIAIVGATTNSVIANKVMIAFVCLFIASFAASWAPVVWVVCGEIFSLSCRGKAVAMSAATNWLVNFVFAFTTPYLVDQGNHTAALGTKIFFIWGGLNLIGSAFVYFIVFETSGLSLEQIDDLYRKCPNARVSSSFQVPSKFNTGTEDTSIHTDDYNDETADTGETELEDGYKPSGIEMKQIPHTENSDNNENNNEINENYNEFLTSDYEHFGDGDYAINLGYGMGLAANRGPPSLLTMTTSESEVRDDGGDLSFSQYVERLSGYSSERRSE